MLVCACACVCVCVCVCACACACACVCVCVCVCVSRDKILRFKNTSMIIIIKTSHISHAEHSLLYQNI